MTIRIAIAYTQNLSTSIYGEEQYQEAFNTDMKEAETNELTEYQENLFYGTSKWYF